MRFHSAAIAGPAFIFAVIGFGTKAGFIPFHVWLPEAHPAAPSHVSALMSGVMIKTGIYGLVRTLTFLSPPQIWWGWLLVGVGLTSGVIGVLFALAQHDLKRLLAYHSVENIGIIALGLGLGLIGTATHQPVLACLGFGGGLLHVLNHALFKGLLFLGAGSVLHATGTREMDRLGGLIKRMPWTSATFAAVEWIYQRISDLCGHVPCHGPTGRIDSVRRGHCRAGHDRDPGGGLFHQSARRGLPWRTPDRSRGQSA
jgi:hydrogenase-4 component B